MVPFVPLKHQSLYSLIINLCMCKGLCFTWQIFTNWQHIPKLAASGELDWIFIEHKCLINTWRSDLWPSTSKGVTRVFSWSFTKLSWTRCAKGSQSAFYKFRGGQASPSGTTKLGIQLFLASKSELQQHAEDQCKQILRFEDVVDAIINSGKTIVGYNCLTGGLIQASVHFVIFEHSNAFHTFVVMSMSSFSQSNMGYIFMPDTM